MGNNRLPRKAYDMLCDLDAKDKFNWVSRVRCKLYQFGFDFVWTNQGVDDVKMFLKILKDRLVACRWQEWNCHIQSSERFAVYRTFCTVNDCKTYLKMDLDRHLKIITAKFRLGISDIAEHAYRYKQPTGFELICPLCTNAKEDELHFVLCCPALYDLRVRYIPIKFHRFPTLFGLSLLLACENEKIVRNLSLYLCKAFQLRSLLLS